MATEEAQAQKEGPPCGNFFVSPDVRENKEDYKVEGRFSLQVHPLPQVDEEDFFKAGYGVGLAFDGDREAYDGDQTGRTYTQNFEAVHSGIRESPPENGTEDSSLLGPNLTRRIE